MNLPCSAKRFLGLGCALVLTSVLTVAQGNDSASSQKKPASKPSSSHSKSSGSKTAAKGGKSSAVSHKTSSKSKTKKSASARRRGQQKIDSHRTQEIQEALVREHYLTGQPSGKWDLTTQEALQKYQADHGWQSKTVPDSRALIKLGLGPSHDHLLNPQSAMTTQPDGTHGGAAVSDAPSSPSDQQNPNKPNQQH